ncbi:hypothetical protein [Propionivibrio sp.]|uniref:hypothetical protein n=1 Tax=Propionivibrio sp. TaxID=2212460 RepID=UPI002638DEB7|nr:hypothetical protein [Propionivibrio sp.]
MNYKQENSTDEESIFIPTEIMGDYQYNDQSTIKPRSHLWKENCYKLKFFIPAAVYVLFCGAYLYLEFIF